MENLNNNFTDKKHWYKSWWGVIIIILAIFILAFFLAFSFYVLKISSESGNNSQGILGLENVKLDKTKQDLITGTGKSYWLGSASPKVTIVEFADFACPLCEKSFPKIREISVKYKNDVKIIHRDYPVISEYSGDLALAARCAGEQGFFWPMHDKLYINQGVSQNNELIELAKQIGADTVKFSFCVEQKKYLKDIENDLSDGNELGLSGTPTWFINGNKIEGNIPYATFIQIIDNLLKIN